MITLQACAATPIAPFKLIYFLSGPVVIFCHRFAAIAMLQRIFDNVRSGREIFWVRALLMARAGFPRPRSLRPFHEADFECARNSPGVLPTGLGTVARQALLRIRRANDFAIRVLSRVMISLGAPANAYNRTSVTP